jgi:hypothetical protein
MGLAYLCTGQQVDTAAIEVISAAEIAAGSLSIMGEVFFDHEIQTKIGLSLESRLYSRIKDSEKRREFT